MMSPEEIQGKTTIVAALIAARAVEVPSLPDDANGPPDRATLRLCRLTDYIYDVITGPREFGSSDPDA
jgi:hypothetical protein